MLKTQCKEDECEICTTDKQYEWTKIIPVWKAENGRNSLQFCTRIATLYYQIKANCELIKPCMQSNFVRGSTINLKKFVERQIFEGLQKISFGIL